MNSAMSWPCRKCPAVNDAFVENCKGCGLLPLDRLSPNDIHGFGWATPFKCRTCWYFNFGMNTNLRCGGCGEDPNQAPSDGKEFESREDLNEQLNQACIMYDCPKVAELLKAGANPNHLVHGKFPLVPTSFAFRGLT